MHAFHIFIGVYILARYSQTLKQL